MKREWLIGLVLCVASGSLSAEDWATSINGEITIAARKNEDRVTRLVADPGPLGIEEQHLAVAPVVNFEAYSDRITVVGQARSEIRRGGDHNEETGTLDELYAEYQVTPSLFVFAGRRNIAFGQASISYALDVFLEPFETDRAKSLDRRRREVVGEDMAGFELLYSPEVTFSGYHLPSQDRHREGEHPDRNLAAVTWVLPWQADAELLILDDERSGVGLSYAQIVGDALLLYAEGMRRASRDRGRVVSRNTGITSARPGNKAASQHTLGANYTFENSLALTLEYYRDENGYSEEEWREIAEFISTPASPFVLLGLNRELRHATLRRNYGFVQISHPGILGSEVASSISSFHNLDDDGGSVSLRFETDLGQSTVGLYGTSAYGSDGAEFKLRSPNGSLVAYLTLRF